MQKLILTILFISFLSVPSYSNESEKKQEKKTEKVSQSNLPVGIEGYLTFPTSDEKFLGGDIMMNKLLTAESVESRVKFATEVRNPEYDTLKYVTKSFKMCFYDIKTDKSIILESSSEKITEEMKKQIKEFGASYFYIMDIEIVGPDGYRHRISPIEVTPKR